MANPVKPNPANQNPADVAVREIAANVPGASTKLGESVKDNGEDIKKAAEAFKNKETAQLSAHVKNNEELKHGEVAAKAPENRTPGLGKSSKGSG